MITRKGIAVAAMLLAFTVTAPLTAQRRNGDDAKAVVADHHVGGIFTDDVRADQFEIGQPEEKLEKAPGLADDSATGRVGVVGPADDIRDTVLLELFLGLTHHADLGNCPEGVGQ